MRVAAVQIPARWNQAERTLDELESVIAVDAFDLVTLPESSLCGYVSPEGSCDVRGFAEPLLGRTFEKLCALARRCNAVVVGPLVEATDDSVFNTQVAVSARGELLAHYRKRHLWHPETTTTPGDLPYPIFHVGSHRCAIAICYDIHFLKDEASSILENVDTLVFPSAWVDLEDSRPSLFKDLSLSYNINIVNANWGRGVPRQPGQGTTQIVDRSGVQIASAEHVKDHITLAQAEIEP